MLCLGFLPQIQTKLLRQIRSIYSLTVPKEKQLKQSIQFLPIASSKYTIFKIGFLKLDSKWCFLGQ